MVVIKQVNNTDPGTANIVGGDDWDTLDKILGGELSNAITLNALTLGGTFATNQQLINDTRTIRGGTSGGQHLDLETGLGGNSLRLRTRNLANALIDRVTIRRGRTRNAGR